MTEPDPASGEHDAPAAPARAERRPRRPLADALSAIAVFALLCALMLGVPALGLLLLPALPIPMALLATRQGARPVLAGGAGLVVAGLLLTLGADPAASAAIVVFLVGFGCAVPLVLRECRMGARFQTGGLVPVSVAVLVVLAAMTAASFAGGSWLEDARSYLVEGARDRYEPLLKGCDDGSRGAGADERCRSVLSQRNMVVELSRDHTVLILAMALAIGSLVVGAVSLWLYRVLAARRELPVHRPHRFIDFRPHWAWTYVLAAGLAAVMVGSQLGDVDDPAVVVGACLAAVAALVLVVHGAAVLAFALEKWRVRRFMRAILWLILGFAFVPMGVGVLLTLSMLDAWRDLRKGAGTPPAGPGADRLQ